VPAIFLQCLEIEDKVACLPFFMWACERDN